jgi:uncharacterized membrane protein (DUF373 family)
MEIVSKPFEKIILVALSLMMMAVVLLSTVELGYILVRDLMSPPHFFFEIDELLDIFGFFLLILIGLELLETIRAYFAEHIVHVEVVIQVALIAIARKVIILDIKEVTSQTLIGIAAIVIALAIAYFFELRHKTKSKIQPDTLLE